MDSNNMLHLQHQIKENSEDLQKYLLDLDSWEKEMKKKEEELKLIHLTTEQEIPPIRNSLFHPKRKNRHKKQKEKEKTNSSNKTSSSTIDYKAWENFNAEEELKKVDEEAKQSSASETSDAEDEFSIQKRKQLAVLHKDKGNDFFKNGDYDSAINSYSTGLLLDSENALLAANRAMAFLKKEQYQAAENDCTLCLSIDPTYVKAYLRRGTARKNLNKFSLAKSDFMKVLEFEPGNKQAAAELKELSQKSLTEDMPENSECEVKTQDSYQLNHQFLGYKIVECASENNSEDAVQVLKNDDTSLQNDMGNTHNNLKTPTLSKTSQQEEKYETIIQKPPLPTVPNTSFQFLTDWNEIVSYPDLRYQYLKQFPPEQFPVFFKHYIEPAIFPTLLETLSSSFIENGDDVFEYLKYLSGVGRFSTMIMFLSDKEENDLKKLLEYVKTSNRPESEVSAVVNRYKI